MAARYAARGVSRVGSFRSGLESKVHQQLEAKGIKAQYEMWRIPYSIPASMHSYRPDFILPNGIIIETKGLWESDDRKKHLLIKEQFPELDIRMVFTSSRSKIYKGSPTSYGDFCEKKGILFADKLIPVEWLKEPRREVPWDKLIKVNKENK
jgi:hypothetical protein